MKRVARLLARIYPAAWRERYGEEFQGLIDDKALRMSDLFDVLWGGLKMQLTGGRLLRIALPCALAGLLIAALISFGTPKLYRSGTVMTLSDVEEAPNSSGASTSMELADPRAAQRLLIPVLVAALGDQDAMESIIRRYDLYPRDQAKMPMDDVIRKMRKAIVVLPLSPPRGAGQRLAQDASSPGSTPKQIRAGFVVRFEYPDPHVAQKVDAEVVGLMIQKSFMLTESRRPAETLSVMDFPNLPDKPVGQPLIVKCAIGLLGGLLCGLLLMMTGFGSDSSLAQR